MFQLSCGHDVAVSLSAEKRYRLMVDEAVRLEDVWGLWDGEDWAVFTDAHGRDCCPVWPCESCAREWVRPGMEGVVPRKIGLDCWVDRWLTIMANKGRLVAVFPARGDDGLVVSPNALFHDVLEELDAYEHR